MLVWPVVLVTVMVYDIFDVGYANLFPPLGGAAIPTPLLIVAEAALVPVQLKVVAMPIVIVVGVAVNVHEGSIPGVTATIVEQVPVPSAFDTVRVYVVVTAGATVAFPESATAPIPVKLPPPVASKLAQDNCDV